MLQCLHLLALGVWMFNCLVVRMMFGLEQPLKFCWRIFMKHLLCPQADMFSDYASVASSSTSNVSRSSSVISDAEGLASPPLPPAESHMDTVAPLEGGSAPGSPAQRGGSTPTSPGGITIPAAAVAVAACGSPAGDCKLAGSLQRCCLFF